MEELVQIQLTTAKIAHNFRRAIEEGTFVIAELTGAGKPMHTERRQNENLIGLQRIEFVINAHILAAMKMNI